MFQWVTRHPSVGRLDIRAGGDLAIALIAVETALRCGILSTLNSRRPWLPDAAVADIDLTLLPIGPVDARVVMDLARALSAIGFRRVAVLDQRTAPTGSYVPERRQHRAESLVALAARQPGDLVLAVTGLDLYSGDLNFVFGLAEPAGKAAVISLHRLGAGGDQDRFREHAVKEAVHELGHVLGLGHCADPRCVMHFSNSLADTDAKGVALCASCRRTCVKKRRPRGRS